MEFVLENCEKRIFLMSKYYGKFGGQFVPQPMMPALKELEAAFSFYKRDAEFMAELEELLEKYVGRPTPLYYAANLSQKLKQHIYLKREDLNHTGAHKINNTIGQILLAKYMGKNRIIAETGAGQHGVATATAAALMNMECIVYMGAEDIERQMPNVKKMRLLGAEVRSVHYGSKTLKEAVTETFKDWLSNVSDTFYVLGSALGPAPYPEIVKFFQKVIGQETKKQVKKQAGKMPDYLIACVGGGSNSIGMFAPFIKDKDVEIIGVEAGGYGDKISENCATLSTGSPGVFQGAYSYVLQTEMGQILPTHSISAGLDYPGVGPEHSFFKDTKKVSYTSVTDEETLEAFHLLCKIEGIISALESSHALAYTIKLSQELSDLKTIVVCLSGRGDKDLSIVEMHKGDN